MTEDNQYRWTGKLFEGRPLKEPYLAGQELVDAVNVALLLGQPLLLTGEPGCGKTRLAYAVAEELDLAEPLVANVKSTTTARDLLYRFDELARFRDAQLIDKEQPRPDLINYVVFDALGRAILYAGGADREVKPMPGRTGATAKNLPRSNQALLRGESFPTKRPVVLVDELDKAPRDTPNDLLDELDTMGFDMPELGVRASTPKSARPVVIITSNSEKSLPEPFLRRCVYYHVPFPEDRLPQIVVRHLVDVPVDNERLQAGLDFFRLLRNSGELRKPPGTAELLVWLRLLTAEVDPLPAPGGARGIVERVRATLPALLKMREDRERGLEMVGRWTWPRPSP